MTQGIWGRGLGTKRVEEMCLLKIKIELLCGYICIGAMGKDGLGSIQYYMKSWNTHKWSSSSDSLQINTLIVDLYLFVPKDNLSLVLDN